jgi:hypothetical protein
MQLYVVMGSYRYGNDLEYTQVLLGVFSAMELAVEKGDKEVKNDNIDFYDIELPKLDEFDWK